MRLFSYVVLVVSLSMIGCSKWNLADKTIGPATTGGTSVVVSLNNLKPTALGNTSASINFKVDKPELVAEYGVVLTTDPSQVPALVAGTAAPLRRVGASGVTPDNFAITGLNENSPYYAVPYAKTKDGLYNYGQQAVGFQTKFGVINANWQQLANLPTVRAYSFNPLFTINGKVYVGGTNQNAAKDGYYYFKQIYEYDPQTNLWANKKDFPGTNRSEATVAVLNNKAYVMFGVALGKASYTPDAWEYDPAADSWRQLANPPATRTGGQGQYNLQAGAVPFVYNNKVSALFGRGTYNNDVNLVNIYNSLYTLDPTANTWDVSFPLNDRGYTNDIIYGAARSGAFSFQYDKWVYFGGGLPASTYNATLTIPYSQYFNSRKIWAYNMDTRETKVIATLPATFNDCSDPNATAGRMAGFAFVVGSKAYITDCTDNQMFIIDLAAGLASGTYTLQATTLRSSIGSARQGTTGVGIGVNNKAYFGLRNADWWEFTP